MRLRAGLLFALVGCSGSSTPEAPPPPPPIAAAPAGTPGFTVVEDKVSADRDTVEVRVAVTAVPEREELDKLLQHLYRQTMTRAGEPLQVSALVYPSAEVAHKSPDKGWIASVTKKRGDFGPSFDNKVALSFSKQVAAVLSGDTFVGSKKPRTEIDDAQRAVVLTLPFVEPGKDEWRASVNYVAAVTDFLDYADRLYEKVPALEKLTFVGVHREGEVIRIKVGSRKEWDALSARDVHERIGAQQGRAFAELTMGKMSDAAVAKEKAARAKKVYQEALKRLPAGAVTASKKLQ